MKPETRIVFTFGAPRSGTTYLERLFEAGSGYVLQKLREGDWLHPCQRRDGLTMIAQLFRDCPPIFVRIVRDPVSVFNSFHGARLISESGAAGQHIPGMYGGIEKVAENQNERIFAFLEFERESVAMQKEDADRWPWEFHLFELEYELMDEWGYLDQQLDRMYELVPNEINRHKLNAFHRTHWKKKPVREGRLSHGVSGMHLDDDLIAEIRRRLPDG